MIRFDSLQQIMILLFIFICKRDIPEGLKLTVHAINSQVTSDKLLQILLSIFLYVFVNQKEN